MDLSSEGLNFQVINVISNSFTDYTRQFVQVRRGKRQEVLNTGKVSVKPTPKVQKRKSTLYSSNSSSTSKDHSGLIRDVMF